MTIAIACGIVLQFAIMGLWMCRLEKRIESLEHKLDSTGYENLVPASAVEGAHE